MSSAEEKWDQPALFEVTVESPRPKRRRRPRAERAARVATDRLPEVDQPALFELDGVA
jgi:hypothetical protein